jgi:hypothetical protein
MDAILVEPAFEPDAVLLREGVGQHVFRGGVRYQELE